MPFLSQRQIAEALRTRAEKEYRSQLRTALSNPALTAEQRRDIQQRLTRVGQPLVYDAKTPPVPGAIQLPQLPQVAPATAQNLPPKPSMDFLRGLKKADLQALAEQYGLSTTGTRTALMERILSA